MHPLPFPSLKDWKKYIKSGDRLFFGSNAACPHGLIDTLLKQSGEFSDLEVTHLLTLGENAWSRKEYRETIRVNALFLGAGTRDAVARGDADYTPCFLSEVPALFLDRILPLDAALVMVSPPDDHGYCSLGVAVDVVSAACRAARQVFVQVNPNMPRTLGQSFIHLSRITAGIWLETPLPELHPAEPDEVSDRIGKYAALLIEDGSTLQMGIGKIPDAVLRNLTHHNDLGIHTEMFSDGVVDLLRKGVINNRLKTLHPNKGIVTFCMGTKKLYDFVNDNPHIEFMPTEYVNNPAVIARNDRMVAINSAIEVDLTGQVVADSVGFRFYSGIGGQVDFIRGAAMSKGGKPIIALPSTAQKGKLSRIVPYLTEGSGVVTSRGDIHYVITEYGIATLRGKSIRERALELIHVAHPNFRDWLLTKVREQFWVPSYHTFKPSAETGEMGGVELEKLRLKGRTYFLRPLRLSDERLLQEFFYSHSPETLYFRYRFHPKRMSREKAQSLVNISKDEGMAVGIFRRKGPMEEIAAVGRYYLLSQDNAAEVALVVKENHRRRGMARELLQRLVQSARQRGVGRMVAYVLRENQPMIRLFEKCGFALKPTEEHQEMMAELDLTAMTGSCPREKK